jgi:ubiquinone/menaquinone biosynthesis C-methylase UbiE
VSSMSDAPSDRLREVYELRAAVSYASPAPLPDPRVDRKFGGVLELLASTLPAESLLDAGCGDGRYLAAAAQLPGSPDRLVGTDISARILRTARETIERAGSNAELVRANIENLPFGDDSFERVLSVQVVEHLLDPAGGVAELARVLRPNGVLVLTTDNADAWVSRVINLPRTAIVRALGLKNWRDRRDGVIHPHRNFSRAEIVTLVRDAGLEIESVSTFKLHVDGPRLARLNRPLTKLERRLQLHRWGDIIAVVARKPIPN